MGATEILIVGGIVVLLFGSSQLPKLFRALGSAKGEFEKAQHETTPSPGVPSPSNPAPSAPSVNDPSQPKQA